MEKTKCLKITKITLGGFRCHKDNTVIDADDMTGTKLQQSCNLVLITGDNGKGKSSIAHAVSYALYGVSAFGVQDIDNIRNPKSDTVSVTLEFIDERGEPHTFNRTRKNADTLLTMDGNTILQKHIDSIFCDKDLFLSMFNPSYFIEVLGGKGKELLALRLPVVKKETVLAKLTKAEQELIREMDLTVPEIELQRLRSENKSLNEESLIVEGQLESVSEDILKSKQRKDECSRNIYELEKQIAVALERKNTGINVDDLSTEKLLIQEKLKHSAENSKSAEYDRLILLYGKVKEREFKAENGQDIADLTAQLNVLSKQYGEVKERIETIKPDDCCPTCYLTITGDNINLVRQNLAERLRQITDEGKGLKANLYTKKEVNKKAEEDFEGKRSKALEEITEQIEALKEPEEINNQSLVNRLSEIEELLSKGNLSDEEYGELVCLEMDKKTSESMLNVLDIGKKEEQYKKLLTRKAEITERIGKNTELIKAVQEFTAKRSEMALSVLSDARYKSSAEALYNVKIKFYEIIRTTGELKNCFKFTYKGYEYSTLSLSEKIKAGIEVASMLRNLTGYDYPIFIDNSESIGDYDSGLLPSQTFFMRFMKGAEFTVKSRRIPKTSQSPNEQQIAA